jgi:dipeptidyl-peptidase-4
MNKRIYLLLLACCIALTQVTFSQKKEISLEDIWQKGTFREKLPESFHPWHDGVHYLQYVSEGNPKTDGFWLFDFASGKKVKRIISESALKNAFGDAAPGSSDDIIWNAQGTRFLLATQSKPIYRHSMVAEYMVYEVSTEKVIAVSNNGAQQEATFSPDGNSVAFVRENNLFVKDLLSGKETQISKDGKRNEVINGIPDWVYEEEFSFSRAFEWSPDSKHIAWIRFDESKVPMYTLQYFEGLYPINYQYKYPKVGEHNAVVSVWVHTIASSSTKEMKVVKEDYYIPRIKWRNANELCVTRLNRLQNELELLLCNITDGSATTLFTEKNPYYIEIEDQLHFLKDGSFLWLSMADGFNHIYYYDSNGKLIRKITNGNWDVKQCYGIDEKSKMIYYQSAEVSPLERHIYSIKLDGTGKKQLQTAGGFHKATFNSAYTYFLHEVSDVNSPRQYAICRSDGKKLRVLEDNAELKSILSEYNLSMREFISCQTSEGITLNGWMMKPANFDPTKKYPVLMHVYGGPGDQQVLNNWGGTRDLNLNYLCQKGYVIACFDNRGSGSRGQEFLKCTYKMLGFKESNDQIDAARYLQTLPYVDGTRIGIIGWSFGGFMSTLCLARGNTVFKTAVAIAPVTDWRFYDSIYTERYMQTDKENKSGYDQTSPLKMADRIKGNYLIVHGMADDNVHYQNTAEMLKALYKNNVAFTQMTFPDKNHGIYGGNTRLYLYTQVFDYLLKNL